MQQSEPSGTAIPVTASALAALLDTSLQGPDVQISSLSAADAANPAAVSVAFDAAQFATALARKPAPGLLVAPAGVIPAHCPVPVLAVADARLALARLSEFFDRRPLPARGRADSAVIAASAQLHDTVSVGACTVIAAGTVIGADTSIGPGCSIHENVLIGSDCRIHANVTLYDGVVLGNRVTLHSGSVLGADGFGYAPTPDGARKIHHLGSVELAADVEVGANTTIDRGTLGITRIGPRTKIDNLCQVAHNAVIGSDCLIAGGCAIGGSSTLEDRVVLAGGVAVTDHITIGTGATIGGRSGVTKNVPPGETWFGLPALPFKRYARRNYLLGQLETIWQAVRGRAK